MNDKYEFNTDNNNVYIGFVESEAESVVSKVLNDKEYDIYHIWGTEYFHSAICVSALKKKKLIDKCIVSIQGLVSVYAKHYAEGIPYKYLKKRTLRDLKNGNTIKKGIEEFKNKGFKEEEVLKNVRHVIGRTNWDKACLKKINENAVYHLCNENLRKCFYDDSVLWNYDSVCKYTIFVSQCSYPVKGFHYLLKAMSEILEKFPNAKIITTGDDFVNIDWRKKIRLDSYKRYLLELIESYNLRDKIEFKGYLTAERMKEQYLSANVFVCPSTIENSPNSVGEAMILGCPVVASYVGGTMDMLKHEEEGYLYQGSSAEMLAYYVCKVFDEKDRTESISYKARKRALLTHDRNTNNRRLLCIYQELI